MLNCYVLSIATHAKSHIFCCNSIFICKIYVMFVQNISWALLIQCMLLQSLHAMNSACTSVKYWLSASRGVSHSCSRANWMLYFSLICWSNCLIDSCLCGFMPGQPAKLLDGLTLPNWVIYVPKGPWECLGCLCRRVGAVWRFNKPLQYNSLKNEVKNIILFSRHSRSLLQCDGQRALIKTNNRTSH